MDVTRTSIRIILFLLVGAAVYGFLRIPELIDHLFPSKSINVLVWPNVIDAEHFEAFEQETGIKVRLSYFENYEELLVKMQSGMGDYDLVMASDYAVRTLIASNVVKPIDKSRIPYFSDIYSGLFGLSFDPDNTYTIPYSWEIYGVGIDTTYYKNGLPDASWALLFDEKESPPHVGMLDDAREVVSIAALYLFGGKNKQITADQMKQIGQLLRRQKKRVAMYTDLRTDYLLVSQSAPAVLGISSDIYHAMHEYDTIKFLLPKEGSFMLMDMWLIPKTTKKDDWVYQFLSYVYQPEVMKKYADRYNFFPAMRGVISDDNRYFLAPTKSLLSRLRLFDYEIPEQQMRELWIALKS